VEPLALHEKIFVDDEFLDEDENHGEIACVDCHGGNPDDPNWKTAHEGLIKDPTYPEATICSECHKEASEHYDQSLHISNRPMKEMIMARADKNPTNHSKLNSAWNNHCTQCHSSCGQCHISRPSSVGGGLMSGHLFQKNPPMQEVCTACHESRVGNEYLGKNNLSKPDIHYEKIQMACVACHPGSQMHGDGNVHGDRYAVQNGPKCLDCHKDIYTDKGANKETHESHKGKASCQVCHAQAYTSCFNCHVSKTDQGQPYLEVESPELGFKIGRNHRSSEKHPEKYVTVRHVPIDPDSFSFYVKNALTNFDLQPTWKTATPHNIRRKTPQNSACNNCHGNTELFLVKSGVRPSYQNANRSVIVPLDEIPVAMTE